MTNPQTEAQAIVVQVVHEVNGGKPGGHQRAAGIVAAALAAKDAELAETVSALWRIPPNMHTIPCEANGFAEPDPFEGVGETYADAYTREKSRADRAEAALADARNALGMMLREHDILSGNFGDVMDPKHRRPDRWPTAAEAARRALKALEARDG